MRTARRLLPVILAALAAALSGCGGTTRERYYLGRAQHFSPDVQAVVAAADR